MIRFAVVRFALCGMVAISLLTWMQPAQSQDAGSLKKRHTDLQAQLLNNPFKRPVYVESTETPDAIKGDIYAVIDQPVAITSAALQDKNHWCDILILHINVKQCQASTVNQTSAELPVDMLNLNIGRKFDQPLADSYLFEFIYQIKMITPDYLQVALNSEKGPFGTSQYHLVIEAVEIDAQHTFLHLSYAYGYGLIASTAMQGYLATIGRDKSGFSIVSEANHQAVYIGGMRGVVERNTMRYYLAIEAYLGALSVSAPEQQAKRLNDWQTGVERYPKQLHELDRSEYIAMKTIEIQRQQDNHEQQ